LPALDELPGLGVVRLGVEEEEAVVVGVVAGNALEERGDIDDARGLLVLREELRAPRQEARGVVLGQPRGDGGGGPADQRPVSRRYSR
jgi:hypothetical protein